MDEASSRSQVALITGVGPGLGTSLCRRLCDEGYAVAGLARSGDYALPLETELRDRGARFKFVQCDVTDATDVEKSVANIEQEWGPVSVFVHNAGQLLIKPFVEMNVAEFESMWRVTCLGAMLAAGAVIPGMKERGGGAMIFTGATASIRGSARFAAMASAKFALRGLAQSLAREYGPQGIHVVHAILDGVMWGGISRDLVKIPRDQCIEPDAVANAYLQLIRQDKSAWTHEIDLRPSRESF